MRCVLKTAVPFLLTLLIGVAADRFLGRILFESLDHQAGPGPMSQPLRIESVPEVDFPDSVKRFGELRVKVRLRALFGETGEVREVIPSPSLPYGGPEQGIAAQDFESNKSRYIVDDLTRNLTQTAIQQVRQIRFMPKRMDSTFVPQWVTVETSFEHMCRAWPPGGTDKFSSISVKVMDNTGVLWQGNTWVNDGTDCFRLLD